jgi:hypothetical protein
MNQWLLRICAIFLSLITLNLQAQTLDENENFWRSEVTRYCGAYPSKDDCDDGDSVIFNGLLCLSGEEIGCQTVKDSQDVYGQFWRSPRRTAGNLGEDKSFSRDQTLGVLLYLVKTKDTEAAIRWMDWIEDNKYCSLKNPLGGNCMLTLYRVCRDADKETCTMTPALWGLTKKVWDYLGLGSTKPMRDFENADVSDLELSTAGSEKPGYRLHLKAVSTFIRLVLGESLSRSKAIAGTLYSRQNENPFFQLLSEGSSPEVERKLLALCPKPGDPLDFVRHQWAWERDQADQAWTLSMGWDCIFVANLLRNYERIFSRSLLINAD